MDTEFMLGKDSKVRFKSPKNDIVGNFVCDPDFLHIRNYFIGGENTTCVDVVTYHKLTLEKRVSELETRIAEYEIT